MENIRTEQSSSHGHERKVEVQRRNLKIIGAAALLAAASFLGIKAKDKLSQPMKISPAECTTTITGGSVWNTAENIAPNRDTRNVVADIIHTQGNEGLNPGNVEDGEMLNLPEKLCESATHNNIQTVSTETPLDHEY